MMHKELNNHCNQILISSSERTNCCAHLKREEKEKIKLESLVNWNGRPRASTLDFLWCCQCTGKYGHGKSKYYLKDNIVWTEKRYWKAYIERNAFCFWPGEWKETQGSWKITGTRRERGDSGDVSTCAEGPDRKMSGNKTLEIEVS